MRRETIINCGYECYGDDLYHIEDMPPTCMLRNLRYLNITCIDMSNTYLKSLDGIVFPDSVTCLAMVVENLDTSKLPPLLQFLDLGKIPKGGDDVVVIDGKLPDSLRNFEICNVRLGGLDFFTPESNLETLSLVDVWLPHDTTLDAVPRTVKSLFLSTIDPIVLTGFPPGLRYLGLADNLVMPHTIISLPQSLETLGVESNIWTMIKRDLPNVVSLTIYDTHPREINWLPPNLKCLVCGRNPICDDVSCQNLSFIWSYNKLDMDGFVDELFGQDDWRFTWCYTSKNWNQVAVSTILLYKPSSYECPIHGEPNNYISGCRRILRDVLGIQLPPDVYSKLGAQARLLALLSGQNVPTCRLRKLPQELFRFLAVFLDKW